jgi:hypothetical protein
MAFTLHVCFYCFDLLFSILVMDLQEKRIFFLNFFFVCLSTLASAVSQQARLCLASGVQNKALMPQQFFLF